MTGTSGLTIVVALVAFAAASLAAAPATPPTLDELLGLTPRAPATQPASAGRAPDESISDVASRELSDEQAQDEYRAALRQMDEAADLLRDRLDPGLPVQRVQRSVLAKLDQVIDALQRRAARQAASGRGGGGQGEPERQDTGSAGNTQAGAGRNGAGSASADGGGRGGGPAGSGSGRDGRTLTETRSEWGHLPPRVRDELLQGLGEQISPMYKAATEAYYKRLAEEAGGR